MTSGNLTMLSDDQPPEYQHLVVYGIDPGSSESWATYRALITREPFEITQLTRNVVPISMLNGFIQGIAEGDDDIALSPREAPVILSLDAPLNMPTRFDVPGSDLPNAHWPFNVNPFSVRPCEKALSSKPRIVNRNLEHPSLAQTVATICGWQGNYRDPQNTKFTGIHTGVSVLGYQGAPHGPVVRLFRDRLRQALDATGVQVVFSPWDALRAVTNRVYLLETHPAVSMALWATQGHLDDFHAIPTYKGDALAETLANCQALCASVRQMVAGHLDTNGLPIDDDNDLDAFVGLLNVIDLVRGAGDWIGTVEQGYFLSPRLQALPDDGLMSEIWRDAATRVPGME